MSTDSHSPHHFPDRQALASRLKAWRKAANKTQREAAHHLGVEKQTVSNWETGRHPIGAEPFLSLVRLYKAQRELLVFLATFERVKGAAKAAGGGAAVGGEKRHAG